MTLSKKVKDLWATVFNPKDLTGLLQWVGDPALPGNVLESGSNNPSRWFDLSGNNNPHIQDTALDQGTRTGSLIEWDGASDFMESPNLFAAISADLSFDITAVVKSGADGESTMIFAVADVDNDTGNLFLRIDGGVVANEHRLRMFWRQGNNATRDSVHGDTDIGANTIAIVNVSGNGSRWRLAVNNIEQSLTIDLGTNDGNYAGDLTAPDNCTIGAVIRATSLFDDGGHESLIYYNEEKTTAERIQLFNYLNNRFSLGL